MLQQCGIARLINRAWIETSKVLVMSVAISCIARLINRAWIETETGLKPPQQHNSIARLINRAWIETAWPAMAPLNTGYRPAYKPGVD